jgi:hypothetical protein
MVFSQPPFCDQVDGEAAQPVSAFVVLSGDGFEPQAAVPAGGVEQAVYAWISRREAGDDSLEAIRGRRPPEADLPPATTVQAFSLRCRTRYCVRRPARTQAATVTSETDATFLGTALDTLSESPCNDDLTPL